MSNKPAPELEIMLRKLRLWAPLSASDEQALLCLPHSIVTLAKQRSFITEGDYTSHCWLILSGYCIRYKIVGDGGRQILSIHMKGDLIDLQNAVLGVADHSVQAITECKMAKIPFEAIRVLGDARPAIKDALWYDTLVDGSIHREWVANVGRRDGAQRIAHLLCEFALKLEAVSLGKQLSYELPMTQDQLADATGMTPVHVNRMLMVLADLGLIQRATPKSVIIGDWRKLAAAGDFNPAYLFLQSAEKRSSN
ncbi:MAG TPA: Crp/Fnr family transcriptional regulator [Sphingomicrobium sp.]|jgi:CRP-like cAMP-binding protein|nr:Crp/Fnr family transcriptional regulator [Sphingomicrobium sp.]